MNERLMEELLTELREYNEKQEEIRIGINDISSMQQGIACEIGSVSTIGNELWELKWIKSELESQKEIQEEIKREKKLQNELIMYFMRNASEILSGCEKEKISKGIHEIVMSERNLC